MSNNWYFAPKPTKTASKASAEQLERDLLRGLADDARSRRNQRIQVRNDRAQRENAAGPKEQGARPRPMTISDYGRTIDQKGRPSTIVEGKVRVYEPPKTTPTKLRDAAAPLVRHVGRPTMGMAVRAAARLNPWFNAADLIAMAYRLWRDRNRSPKPASENPTKDKTRIKLPPNYEYCNGPVPARDWGSDTVDLGPWYVGVGIGQYTCTENLPWGWQYDSGERPLTEEYHGLWRPFTWASWGTRLADLQAGIRRKSIMVPQPQPTNPWLSQDWGIDPNLERYMPQTPQPFVPPQAPPVPSQGRIPDTQLEVSPSDKPIRRYMPHDRRFRGGNERKFKTRSAQLAVALYKALNFVDESAEIVNAFYEALPKHIQDRWDRIAQERYGKFDDIAENFGQYGIGGLGHQLEALYYNWDHVDMNKAIYNVFKNQLSDSIIGGIHKQLPKNTGQAHEGGEIEFATALEDIIDAVATGKESQINPTKWVDQSKDWYSEQSAGWKNPFTNEWTFK